MKVNEFEINDIICLNAYPYKPFKVKTITQESIILQRTLGQGTRRFNHEQFEQLGYIHYAGSNLWK